MALLADVENYATQIKEPAGKIMHTSLDGYPDWLITYLRSGNSTYANDPIIVGEWMLAAVDSRKPWPEVEEYLLDNIFLQADERSTQNLDCIGRKN